MAKKQLIRKITWIRDRDVNGNYGYRNIKTGEFRITLSNSKEEVKQNQSKLNKAVLVSHLAKQQRYINQYSKIRNHSDEAIKKQIEVPYLITDKQGNLHESSVYTQAPSEDSAQIDNTLEGLLIGDKVFRLGSGLTKMALTKTGNNYFSHWAKNSLLNEATKDLTKNFSSNAIFNGKNLVPKKASLEDNSIQSMSYYKPIRKAWTNGNGKGNAAMSYFFRQQPNQRFELVKDIEPNNYSVHFKTDQGALNYGQKMQLFAKVADEIPEGANVSTWGSISKGGIHGVNRFGKDFGFNQVGTRQLTMKGTGEPINLGIFQKPLYNITSMSSTNTEIPKDVQLALFNQGRLALMQRYNNNPIWENLAKQAGLSDDLVSSFRDYATKLLSTKQSPEPHLAPLIIRESPGQYSQSVVVPSKSLPLKRYLDYKINSNPQPHYTGVHEGAHMSTLNYDPATEYRAYGQLILNPKAKTAITKLMNNADDLAAQLEVDPQKIKILRDNLIRVQGKTPTEADQIIQHQIQYLKTGQETRSRGLAAQEWIEDNHSVDVPDNIDNGVNFFTDKSLRNVWRNMAIGLPSIWGTFKMIQNDTQEK